MKIFFLVVVLVIELFRVRLATAARGNQGVVCFNL